jgi:hypothetical protein
MPTGHFAHNGTSYVCGVLLFPAGTVEWRDIRGRELGLSDLVEGATGTPTTTPTTPTPTTPTPATMTSFQLDYDPRRVTRLGVSVGPWWNRTSITKVENRSGVDVLLGIHDENNYILAADTVPSGRDSSAFNGYNATQRWVGRGGQGLGVLGPFNVHYANL